MKKVLVAVCEVAVKEAPVIIPATSRSAFVVVAMPPIMTARPLFV